MLSRLQKDLLSDEDLLYGLVPKEALREALLQSYSADSDFEQEQEKVRKIVNKVNKAAATRAFQNGLIRPLQDEIWRLREEEGMVIEDEEDKINELLAEHFIQI